MPNSKDDFWDLSKLIPTRRPATSQSNADAAPDKSEKSKDAVITSVGSGHSFPIRQRELKEKIESEYRCENSRIKHVTVSLFYGGSSIYDSFAQDVIKYRTAVCRETPFIPFFSYIPQYSHMSRLQFSYYLYWRDELRHGRYIQSDFSYIVLYLQEIINSPRPQDPQSTVEAICKLWLAYRDSNPRIDKYLCEWVCDFCLLYQIEPPYALLDPIMPMIINTASLKEFYISSADSISNTSAIIDGCSSYNWKKSKFATGNAAKLCRTHIPAAIAQLFSDYPEFSPLGSTPAVITRDAFCGALCTSLNKRKIKVEYYPFSRARFSDFAMSDLVKYAENKVRAALGAKNRLRTGTLPEHVKKSLDRYFEKALPSSSQSTKKSEPEAPEYEKYYVSINGKFDPENAARIEKSSWDATRMLVSDDTESETEIPKPIPAAEQAPEKPASSDTLYAEYICAILEADNQKAESVLKRAGMDRELFIEQLNEAALERFSDILFEVCEDGYTLIEDYRKEAEEWATSVQTI